ncbi:MAG: hypothetical protein U1D30_19260 [Planctomycetota bacterium]
MQNQRCSSFIRDDDLISNDPQNDLDYSHALCLAPRAGSMLVFSRCSSVCHSRSIPMDAWSDDILLASTRNTDWPFQVPNPRRGERIAPANKQEHLHDCPRGEITVTVLHKKLPSWIEEISGFRGTCAYFVDGVVHAGEKYGFGALEMDGYVTQATGGLEKVCLIQRPRIFERSAGRRN